MRRRAKAVVIGAFSGIYLILGFLFWTASASIGDERALELFKEKKYRYAHAYVEELEKSSTDPHYPLFEGYIFRAKDDLLSSDIRLQQSLRYIACSKPSKKLLLEVYLNQALNAYLADDTDKLALSIKNAENLKEPDYGWVRIFTSIHEMKTNKKRSDLSNHEKSSLKYLSPWMEEAFRGYFNDTWFALHQARWLIDEGRFIVARQKLEDLFSQSEQQEEIQFLFGLSYAKEAESRNLDAAAPYYKLAFSYFDKISAQKYSKERKILAINLQKQVRAEANIENFSFYFSLLQKLSPWIDVPALVSDIAMMIEQADCPDDLIQAIAKSAFTKEINEYMEAAAQVALRNRNYEKVEYYSQIITLLKNDNEQNYTGQIIEEEILRIALCDNAALDQTIPLLSLWNKLESDEKQRLAFASRLVRESERIWTVYGNHRKAINLMKLAEQSCLLKAKSAVHQLIETSVGNIYRSAVICDKVSQYFGVMEAVRALQLVDVDVFNPEETMHQLGDAEYYFEKHRFQEANERALWVLQVDPQNQIANRIAGLIAHTEGRFEKAVLHLSKLAKPDPLAKEALDLASKK